MNSIEIDTATSESVNGLVNDLGRVLLDTAETVFGKSKKKLHNPDHENKPWFNNECRIKRDAFHKSKSTYNKAKSDAKCVVTYTFLNLSAQTFSN